MELVQRLALLLFTKEALGRVMRIDGHLEMMEHACAGCSCFKDFGIPIKKENGEVAERLEKCIVSVEGEKKA